MLLSITDSRVSAETKSSGMSFFDYKMLLLNHFVRCKLCPSNWQGSRPSHRYHHPLRTLRLELCQVIFQSTWSWPHWRASPSHSRCPLCSWCLRPFRLPRSTSNSPQHWSRILHATSPRTAQYSSIWVWPRFFHGRYVPEPDVCTSSGSGCCFW